jgi:hypothetical protein
MKTIIVIASLLFISTANAGYLGGKTPLYIYGSKGVAFGIAKQNLPKDLCSYWGRQFTFDATTESGKNMLSILLAAKMANKKIDIWYRASKAPGTSHTNGCKHSTMAVLTMIGIHG